MREKHGDTFIYHLHGRCNVVKCSCLNGIGSSGANCPSDGANRCDSCNTGWRVSSNKAQCIANECSCENGKAATGAKCATHGSKICENCDAGFKLDSDKLSCAGTVLLNRFDDELGSVCFCNRYSCEYHSSHCLSVCVYNSACLQCPHSHLVHPHVCSM